ncbi:MAG: hypothetical protein ACYDD1_14800 [Caulobacteraceae bacterium]
MKRGGLMERLLDRLRPAGVSAQDVRAEAWALGSRHKGEVVAGARLELEASGVKPARAALLKAVIRATKT